MCTPAPAFPRASEGVPKRLLRLQHPPAQAQPTGGFAWFKHPWEANPMLYLKDTRARSHLSHLLAFWVLWEWL